jgi:hypothetical protein
MDIYLREKREKFTVKNLFHSLGLVYKSMRGMMTNSIIFNFALGRNWTRDPRVTEPKRTPLGYILPLISN